MMGDQKRESRKPDYRGFVVKSDGKADFNKPVNAVWFHDDDIKPTKPFTMVGDTSPKKVRFFSLPQLEEMNEKYKKIKAEMDKKTELGGNTKKPD